jgi:glycine hydroxymethyltransferase
MPSTFDNVLKHEGWRSSTINLIASENITSKAVRTVLTSDLGHRYSLKGSITKNNFYMGTKYLEEILDNGTMLAKKLFNAKHADLRPVSGHVSAMAVLMLLTREYDSIMSLNLQDGGYPGYTMDFLPNRLNLHIHEIPFDQERFRIDIDACAEQIGILRPALVIIGPSMIIFPTPLHKIAKVCNEVGSELIYDGSHVLGLIGGKAFPNPLTEGTHILLGSTHKSFPGPQGGIILTDKEHAIISDYLPLRIIDNPHFNRVAALSVAMEEMLVFGRKYAQQVVLNAKALARALDKNGIEVLGKKYGYTETHQILLKHFNGDYKFLKALESANIIADSALRLGTCEVTRLGMKESEMRYIAELIASVYRTMKTRSFKTRIKKIKKETEEFVKKYNRIFYAFDLI